jgi:hypothetical protein
MNVLGSILYLTFNRFSISAIHICGYVHGVQMFSGRLRSKSSKYDTSTNAPATWGPSFTNEALKSFQHISDFLLNKRTNDGTQFCDAFYIKVENVRFPCAYLIKHHAMKTYGE